METKSMEQVRMMKREDKPETKLKRSEKPETATVDFEKIFYETVLEIAEASQRRGKERRIVKTRLRDQIIRAQSWPERDQLLKSLAAKSYEIANSFIETDTNQSLKWLKLTARLLSLSFVPKRLEDLELIKKEIGEVKGRMQELEEDGEDDDGES